jgi:hypothetical protein
MLDLAKVGQVAVAKRDSRDFDEERAGVVALTVRLLLGIEG